MKASVSLYIQSPKKNYSNTSNMDRTYFQTSAGYNELIFDFFSQFSLVARSLEYY